MSASVPFIVINGVLYALGSVQGGQDLSIDLGLAPKSLALKGTGGTVLTDEDSLEGLAGAAGAGSAIIAQSHGLTTSLITTSMTLGDNQAVFVMIDVLAARTISGVGWLQTTQGNYTADQTNQVGLFSLAAGTFTLIASSANNGNLWKSAGASFVTELFSATVDVTPGVYWAAFVFNYIAFVTAPQIGASTAGLTIATLLDLTNNAKTFGATSGGSNALPATIAATSVLAMTPRPWVCLI